jgi:Recombinase zinc beta ribbon domain
VVSFGKRKMKLNRATGRRVPIYLDPSTHKSYTDEKLRIISDEDFAMVEGKMAGRRKSTGSSRARRQLRPFTGLIYCSECNSIFYAQKSTNGGQHYYVCSCRQKHGRTACPKSITLREDQLLGEVMDHFATIWGDTDWFIRETIKGVEAQMGSNREDAARLKAELSDLNTLSTGLGRLLMDPDLSPGAKSEINRQLDDVASKRSDLKARMDRMGEQANMTTEYLITETRRALDEARERLSAVADPDELHAFVERFVGPSVSYPTGKLLPLAVGDASAHSNIAATGLEPVTRGL